MHHCDETYNSFSLTLKFSNLSTTVCFCSNLDKCVFLQQTICNHVILFIDVKSNLVYLFIADFFATQIIGGAKELVVLL